ncbi:fyve, partial [Tropilaelaps mercedesae]
MGSKDSMCGRADQAPQGQIEAPGKDDTKETGSFTTEAKSSAVDEGIVTISSPDAELSGAAGEEEVTEAYEDEPTYPCICEHLENNGRPSHGPEEDQVPSMAAVRRFWLKKSMEGADLLMRYQVGNNSLLAAGRSGDTATEAGRSAFANLVAAGDVPRGPAGQPWSSSSSVACRDSGNSSVASSSSSRSSGPSCCTFSQHPEPPHHLSRPSPTRVAEPGGPVRSPVRLTPMQDSSKGAPPASNPTTDSASARVDPASPTNSISRKPLTGVSKVDTLERNRIDAIEDEHKYETLDHGARPGYYSEDEGICCTNIHSTLAKKAKELVRPYQKGDHPRDRPPIPAKPPRPSLIKATRAPSTSTIVSVQFADEGISDRESNYRENLDLVKEVKTAAQQGNDRI